MDTLKTAYFLLTALWPFFKLKAWNCSIIMWDSMIITSIFSAEHPLPAKVTLTLLLETKNQENIFCFPLGSSSVCTSSYFLNDTHQLSSFNVSTSTLFPHNTCTYTHMDTLSSPWTSQWDLILLTEDTLPWLSPKLYNWKETIKWQIACSK